MIGQVIQATKVDWNAKKGSAAHLWWAMMTGWVIWVNESQPKCEKKTPKSLKNEKLIFIWCLTSDDWPRDLSNKSRLNAKKGPLSHHKMKYSFLDYVQLLMIGWTIWAMKVDWNVAKGPLSHWTIKCSFLDYIQLLMIGQVIQVMKVDQNAKKWNVVSVRVFCCFS